MSEISPIRWDDQGAELLDQRELPWREVWLRVTTPDEMAAAIRDMVIRGAPAIGIAGAYGVALAARGEGSPVRIRQAVEAAGERLAAARPTAVNLRWAVDRMLHVAAAATQGARDLPAMRKRIEAEAVEIHREDVAVNRRLGLLGAELLPDEATVLTHCNAGALATGGYGTALGVIRAAVEAGKRIRVLADETRPYLQGARLTAWELQRDGIPVTLLCDNTAGAVLRAGRVAAVLVGADRIAANGDTANKIGTYPLAVLAHRHAIPFYVVAPSSTLDRALADGQGIPIEERPGEEVTRLRGLSLCPDGVPALHLGFDVTPAELVSAIIMEDGVHRPPFRFDRRGGDR